MLAVGRSLPQPCRLAVLISGRGRNLQAIARASRRNALANGQVVRVLSTRSDAAGLNIARMHGLPTHVLSGCGPMTAGELGREIARILAAESVHLVVLAGFMRVLPKAFVREWQGRVINIHPSLLPAHRGMNPHHRAIANGDRVSGCSVHWVDETVDGGPTIAQSVPVPIVRADTETSLAAKVLARELDLFPRAISAVISGAVRYPRSWWGSPTWPVAPSQPLA